MPELPKLLRIIRHEPEASPGWPAPDASDELPDPDERPVPGLLAGAPEPAGEQDPGSRPAPRPPMTGPQVPGDQAAGLPPMRLTGRRMTGREHSAVRARHWAERARDVAADRRGLAGGVLGPVLDHIAYVRSRSWVPHELREEPLGRLLSLLGAVIGYCIGTPLVAGGSAAKAVGQRNGRVVIAIVLGIAAWLAYRYGR